MLRTEPPSPQTEQAELLITKHLSNRHNLLLSWVCCDAGRNLSAIVDTLVEECFLMRRSFWLISSVKTIEKIEGNCQKEVDQFKGCIKRSQERIILGASEMV